jgi:hypothetical protein
LNGFCGTPLHTLVLTFTGIANQGKSGLGIYLDTLYRTGPDAYGTSVTFVLIELNPILPTQCIMRAGRDTLMVFAGQTHSDYRCFRPVRGHINAGTFGGILAKMGP